MRAIDVAGVILAAGQGRRFGAAPKLLALLDGKPLVRHVAEAALAVLETVLVVVGERESEIRAALAGLPVVFVPNPNYAAGLSTSLQEGFASRPEAAEAVLVLLGDMPRVSPRLLERLLAAWRDGGKPIALVPLHDGHHGNPVLLTTRLAPQIAELTGDTGAAPLLRGRPSVLEWETDDAGVSVDVDTPDALARLAAQA
jgi:molybdenum cofactor cytidylyltransferase